MTQKDTLRRAAELMESGLRVYNHNDCNNDLTERRVGGQICSSLTHAKKVYDDMYRVFVCDKAVGTYKTAMGAARKLAQLNRNCTAFFAQHYLTDEYTFLTDYPVFKD
jgi:hypothetical protein